MFLFVFFFFQFNILVISISALVITSGILATVYKNSVSVSRHSNRSLQGVVPVARYSLKVPVISADSAVFFLTVGQHPAGGELVYSSAGGVLC